MKFTQEQLDILVKGFQQHDITQSVHLPGGLWNAKPGKEPEREYNPLEKRVLSYMKRNLSALGFIRNMNNFSNKHPVNLLMSADAQYISDEAMKIFEDGTAAQDIRIYYRDIGVVDDIPETMDISEIYKDCSDDVA